MRKKPTIEFKCEKCGEPQAKSEPKSNGNWSVFDAKVKCHCGGQYKMFMGEEIL